MFIALDRQGNRVHADDAIKSKSYICQKCGEEVKPKQGNINKWHFAHVIDVGCDYGKDSDHKGEWHMRMQEYFPKETREYRFVNKKTNETHIADIYMAESNIIVEFQHSSINEDEFLSRTWFHLTNGRRIVWVFNESNNSNKFRFLSCRGIEDHNKEWYKWIRPRKILIDGPEIFYDRSNFAVCIYNGKEGDTVRRILNASWDFKEIALSNSRIEISDYMNADNYFDDENYWNSFEQSNHMGIPIHLKKIQYRYEKPFEFVKEYLGRYYSLKYGDSIYYKRVYDQEIVECKLIDFDYGENVLRLKYNNSSITIPVKYLGKTAFKTYEEAKSSK